MCRVRACVVCGSGMERRRRGALVCSPACRRERSRILSILTGRGTEPYASVVARLEAARNRANGATGGALKAG